MQTPARFKTEPRVARDDRLVGGGRDAWDAERLAVSPLLMTPSPAMSGSSQWTSTGKPRRALFFKRRRMTPSSMALLPSSEKAQTPALSSAS